jgi:hypothetical protein
MSILFLIAIRVSISSSFSFNHTNILPFECRSLIKVSAAMYSVADKMWAPVTEENGYLGESFVVSAALWLRIQVFWGVMSCCLVNVDRCFEGIILLWILKSWRWRHYAASKHWKTLTRKPRGTFQKIGIVNRYLCLFDDVCDFMSNAVNQTIDWRYFLASHTASHISI